MTSSALPKPAAILRISSMPPGEFIPLPSATFDLILSHEVIEHVQDDRAAIREMIRVLKTRRTDRSLLSRTAAIHLRPMEFIGRENIILATNYS